MMRDYLSCPALFHYRYIARLKLPEKPEPLVFGGMVHDMLEEYFKTGKAPEYHFEIRDNLAEEATTLVRHFADQWPVLCSLHGIDPKGESEVKFRSQFIDPVTAKAFPVPFTGRHDRLTASGQVLEFKTSKKNYKQEDIDVSPQGSVYSLERLMTTGEIPIVIYVVIRKGLKTPQIQVLTTQRTKYQLSQFLSTAEGVLAGIMAKRFPKGNGHLHQYCDCWKYDALLKI